MKKVLIGCGVVLLVCLLICTGITVFGVVTVQNTVQKYETAGKKIDALNKSYPFTPDATGTLTPEQLDRFFQVRTFLTSDLQNDPLIKKFIDAANKGTQPNVGPLELLSFAANYPPALMERAAAEMDRLKISPAEYAHTARMIYATIEQGKATGQLPMADLYAKIEAAVDQINNELMKNPGNAQNTVNFVRTMQDLNVGGEIPAANFEALSQFTDRILEFPQLTFFEFLLLKKMNEGGNSLPPVQLQPTTE